MATKVGTATAAEVLSGKTFTNSSGVGISGTMTDRGAWTNTPTASGKITIPAGYHNGSGYVDTSSVYSTGMSAGTASSVKSGSATIKIDPDAANATTTINCGFKPTKISVIVATYNDFSQINYPQIIGVYDVNVASLNYLWFVENDGSHRLYKYTDRITVSSTGFSVDFHIPAAYYTNTSGTMYYFATK